MLAYANACTNYAMFCQQTGFGDGQIYRRILDLIWETLTVKDAKVNFDSQLEKFEEAIMNDRDEEVSARLRSMYIRLFFAD